MSRRLQRVNELLKREISAVIQREFEFPGTLVTVNGVEATQDLREAKVFIGIFGSGEETVLSRLQRSHGLIQARVAKRVTMKQTPVLDFRLDDTTEKGVDLINLLNEVDQIPKARDPESPEDEGAEG